MPLGKVAIVPGHIVLDGDPVGTQPPTAAPLHFRPMPFVAKRSPIWETAELLVFVDMLSRFVVACSAGWRKFEFYPPAKYFNGV